LFGLLLAPVVFSDRIAPFFFAVDLRFARAPGIVNLPSNSFPEIIPPSRCVPFSSPHSDFLLGLDIAIAPFLYPHEGDNPFFLFILSMVFSLWSLPEIRLDILFPHPERI